MIQENIIDRKLMALGEIGMTLGKAWPLWIVLGCILFPSFFPWKLDEKNVTRLGVVYEAFGIFAVAYGIASKMGFAEQNLPKKVWVWFRELFANMKLLVVGPKRAYANLHTSGRGNTYVTANVLRAEFKLPELTLEEQVKALAIALNDLKNLMTEVEKNAREKAATLERMIEAHGKEMTVKVNEAYKSFKSALADDYKLEFVGLFVTLVGMVYNSIPKDIIKLFGR